MVFCLLLKKDCTLRHRTHIGCLYHSLPHTLSDGLVCNEPSLLVISVSLHMSVITQRGQSPLMLAVGSGSTEVVSLLVKAGAALDLQDKVLIPSLSNAVCVLVRL